MRLSCLFSLVTILAVCVAPGPTGCSDDSSAGVRDGAVDGGVDADLDATGDGTVDASVGTLTVVILTWDVQDATWVPTGGATVALDAPGGFRLEQTTDTHGRTTFEGLNWSAGTASVTGHLEGYQLRSFVGFTGEDVAEAGGEFWMGLWRPVPADRVEIFGSAQNMADPNHYMVVSTCNNSANSEAQGPDWSLEVAPDRPFTLVAAEYSFEGYTPSGRGRIMPIHGWVVLDHGGVSDATSNVDIDFTAGATPFAASGSFLLPSRPQSVVRTADFAQVAVMTLESDLYALLGFTSYTDISNDGNSFEYDLEWVEPQGAATPLTQYSVLSWADNWVTWSVVEGYPNAGPQDPGLLDLPEMIAPADPATPHPLHDPIEWALSDSGVRSWLFIYRFQELVWMVHGPLDGTTVTVPEPPGSVDVEAVLGTVPLDGVLIVGTVHPIDGYLDRAVQVRPFLLAP